MVFTRFLYYKPNVVCSLFISILENNIDETLFWGYELYYSGFVNDLLEYLLYISENIGIFKPLDDTDINIQLKQTGSIVKFIRKKYNEFIILPKTDQSRDCIIGTMIRNIIQYKTNKTFKKIRIIYQDKDIIKYREPIDYHIKPHLFLSFNCIYSVRTISQYKNNECSQIIPTQFIETNFNNTEILENWRTRWEYYSTKSPFWMNILELHSGSPNHEKKTIEFKNEKEEERFYNKYGYEPDEQSNYIRIRCLGDETVKP